MTANNEAPNSTTGLKPCPCCGGRRYYVSMIGHARVSVECVVCKPTEPFDPRDYALESP